MSATLVMHKLANFIGCHEMISLVLIILRKEHQ